jgi:predicted dehydrogenase
MAEQVGIAVIGCGYWGGNYVRVFNELPTSRVVIACDQRMERLSDLRHRFPGLEVTTELETALQTPGVDAVVVCTPAASHYEITRRCLLMDKAVLVEKPMTTTTEEATQLIELAEQRRKLLMVGHTFIYNTGVRKVREYLAQEALGRVYYLYSRRTNLGPIRYDVNALWDLAPHDISIFNYLLGSTPLWASAVGVRALQSTREDVGFISLGYPGDVVAHIHVSWLDPSKVREVVVVGSDRRIVFNDVNPEERVRVFEKGIAASFAEGLNYGEQQLHIRDGNIVSPQLAVSEPLKAECMNFLECLVEERRPDVTDHDGREVVRIMGAIDRSLAAQGAPVAVE